MRLNGQSVTKQYLKGSVLCKVWPIFGKAKPRMTRSDKWKKRPIVLKYRAYKDELRYMQVTLDMEKFYHVIFVIPIPASWSEKKRGEHWFAPMQQTPDKDNLEKGLLDALFDEDARAWDGRVTKVWGPMPYLLISEQNMDVSPKSISRMIVEAR